MEKGGFLMKKYVVPEFSVAMVSCEDILNGSDTFVDVSGLWSDTEQN